MIPSIYVHPYIVPKKPPDCEPLPCQNPPFSWQDKNCLKRPCYVCNKKSSTFEGRRQSMNKFNKTVLALALTASLGFGGQAFAQDMAGTGATGGTSNGTHAAGTTTGALGTGMTTGDYGNAGATTGTGTTTGTYGTGTGTTGTTGAGTTGTGTGIGGALSGMGNSVRNYSDNMLDRMNTYNNTNDTTGYGFGGNYNTATYRTNAATDNDTDWGWLGLLGLLGLAGLRSRNRDKDFTTNNR
jgi:MYXO-CTERM domain-containing protein